MEGDPLKLHLACGGVKLGGYVNVDIRPEVEPDLLLDLRGVWPWHDETVAEILTYHFIEHLDRHEAEYFLGEAFRVLHHGGRLILELPDLKRVCEELVAGNLSRIDNLYGLHRNPYDYHKMGYTRETLTALLKSKGFGVQLVIPGTDYHAEEEPCMRVEAVKL